MQGIIFFLLVLILNQFEVDLICFFKKIYPFRIGINENYLNLLDSSIISGIVFFLSKLIYNLNFLKRGFDLEITQLNKKNKNNSTILDQYDITEKKRTVTVKLDLISKKSWRNRFLKSFLKNKKIKLEIKLEEKDNEYISLYSDNGDEFENKIIFDITSYLNQILNLSEEGVEEFSYIIISNIEKNQEKMKKILINTSINIGEKNIKNIKILKILKIDVLMKIKLNHHTVELNREKE